jgi:anaerobic selenocysteine-containing dehydrogenase
MLAAITGNIDNPGGRCPDVRPEWISPTGPDDKPIARRLELLQGFEDEAALPFHGLGHRVLKMIQDGHAGRPEVYLWYNYNPVFSNADTQENSDILKDESLLAFTVAVTPFYDESAALADLILPDALYLERFDFEDGASPDQVPEYTIRQPIVPPQGEVRDFKDVCCELARRLDIPLGFESAEEFVEQSCKLTPEVKSKAGGFKRMLKRGVWHDPKAVPRFYSYKQAADTAALREDGVILDEATGVYWSWKAAGVASESEALATGYRDTPGAQQGYLAQRFGDQVYAGFRDELILTTFRVNVQTLSRTQNCMWLNEIDVDNSAWINPKTAATRGIADGERIRIGSPLGEIEATAKVTRLGQEGPHRHRRRRPARGTQVVALRRRPSEPDHPHLVGAHKRSAAVDGHRGLGIQGLARWAAGIAVSTCFAKRPSHR